MVKVYSSDSCMWCQKLKRYLDSKGIRYEELNVSNPEYAKQAFELTKQKGVPVTVMGNNVIVGFDPAEIDKAAYNITQ